MSSRKESASLIKDIAEEAKKWNLSVDGVSKDSITIRSSPFLGISLRLWIEASDLLYFDFYCRTTSWHYNGERTDLHDIFSLFFSIFLKKMALSSVKIINVMNPATFADSEIYGVYIIPKQINPGLINIRDLDKNTLSNLIESLFVFEQYIWGQYNGCPCQSCRDRLGYSFTYRWEDIDIKELKALKTIIGFNERVNYMERTLPSWLYYRNFKKRISVIKSHDIIDFISAISKSKETSIDGINGKLITTENFHHFVSFKKKTIIYEYFKKLQDAEPILVVLENKIIGIGGKYILSLDINCGLDEFKKEREKLRERHNKEFEILFQPSTLEWQYPINDSLFENLIKDLLEREPNVTRVRKLASTREPDGGVDLIVEWLVPKEAVIPDEDPYIKYSVVVQCKAYKNGVGKSDVQDIRDTVESRDYEGYFLAVSSYTKRSLTDYLDKLRTSKKLWVEWWTKSEIEDRESVK
ncbi:restriction endonuclease [Pedobacter changchengzhani]|uniref:Restriction endonuclease n=1 Tax=Pedobacter changchengzhani TaxID=2529274 RepID=A0A4R5MLG6_9SPHI|nr:restriction endonuclease [Pedobacter changchengzhani]TDG36075.1 restriction endonuclease [Pedobacter changchengzhani]